MEGAIAPVEQYRTKPVPLHRFLMPAQPRGPTTLREIKMTHRMRSAALLLSVAVALTSVPLAAASAQTKSIKVHSYDLDLSTSAGQQELQHRIQRAVERVCGSAVGARMDDIMSYAACTKAAQARAMSQYEVVVRTAHDPKVATGDATVR
jgi:UrcA family protein